MSSVEIAGKLLTKHYGIEKKPRKEHEGFLRSVLQSNEENPGKQRSQQKEIARKLLADHFSSQGAMENNREIPDKQRSLQKDKLIAALYARALLRADGKEHDEATGYKAKALAYEFEKEACDQLENLQDDDMKGTEKLLLESFASWGGLDCISLAIKTRCGRFLAIKSAHEAVSHIWNGMIDCHPNSIKFWTKLYLALLFPPMLFSLHFKWDEQDSTENRFDGRCWRGLLKIYHFYRAPTVAFRLNVIFYIAFLGLYSYMILVEFGEKVGWSEIVIYAWLVTMVLGEINQANVDNRSRWAVAKFYVSNTWNIVDFLRLFIFIVGGILRPFHFHNCVDVVRVIYSIDLIIFCARFLQILTVNKYLGPKLVMIRAMFKDLVGFFVILITIVYGYAVATEAILYPNSRLTWRLPYFLARKAYFQIFGELFLEEIDGSDSCTNNATLYEDHDIPRCPSSIGIWIAPVLLGGYVLLTNILLLNLLIAMFTTTFNRIQSEEEQHWNLDRAILVLEYDDGPAFPPPFNVLCILCYNLYKKFAEKEKRTETQGSCDGGNGNVPSPPFRTQSEDSLPPSGGPMQVRPPSQWDLEVSPRQVTCQLSSEGEENDIET